MTGTPAHARLLRERPLPAQQDATRDTELRQARRALLGTPWITREQSPDDFRLVRRHRESLAAWFSEALGYEVRVESDTARLRKVGAGNAASRPLVRAGSQRAFTPRGYAVLVCLLAAVSGGRSQALLDDLARDVRSAAAEAGIELDLERVGDRRLLHHALRHLLDLGVLAERDGTVEGWDVDVRVQALLDIRRDRLALLLEIHLDGADSPEAFLRRDSLPSAAGGARLSIRRTLVESPLLDVSGLTDDQAHWWRRNRGRETEQLQEWLGLTVELRAEGAVAVDPSDGLTDRAFPGQGTVPHAALLVLSRLVDGCRSAALAAPAGSRAWHPVPHDDIRAAVVAAVEHHGRTFAKEYREDPAALTVEVVQLLRDFGLLRSADDGRDLELHAAAARYAPRVQGLEPPTLFDMADERDSGEGGSR